MIIGDNIINGLAIQENEVSLLNLENYITQQIIILCYIYT